MTLSHRLMPVLSLLLGLGSGVVSAQDTGTGQVEEFSQARYQSTYNTQQHPAFAAAGSGLNSLGPGADKMFTFSLTGHWGKRFDSGAEVYLNTELASGVPFSNNLVGLGGFTNGEITRAAGTTPKAYVQRLFWRQTWNQGGVWRQNRRCT